MSAAPPFVLNSALAASAAALARADITAISTKTTTIPG
jgi:hypothetical protein